MSRISGNYDDGTPRQYGDFLRTYRDETVNLLEINDEGDLVVATMDALGKYDSMSVQVLETYLADFVRHWSDPEVFVASFI